MPDRSKEQLHCAFILADDRQAHRRIDKNRMVTKELAYTRPLVLLLLLLLLPLLLPSFPFITITPSPLLLPSFRMVTKELAYTRPLVCVGLYRPIPHPIIKPHLSLSFYHLRYVACGRCSAPTQPNTTTTLSATSTALSSPLKTPFRTSMWGPKGSMTRNGRLQNC